MAYKDARAAGLTASQAFALSKGYNPLTLPAGGGIYKGNGGVGGHHVLQRAAFENSPGYNPNKAFAISNAQMDFMDTPHTGTNSVTSAQKRLQKQLGASGKPNTMENQARVAYDAIIQGARPNADMQKVRSFASQAVIYAVTDMYAQGVVAPSRIPYT